VDLLLIKPDVVRKRDLAAISRLAHDLGRAGSDG